MRLSQNISPLIAIKTFVHPLAVRQIYATSDFFALLPLLFLLLNMQHSHLILLPIQSIATFYRMLDHIRILKFVLLLHQLPLLIEFVSSLFFHVFQITFYRYYCRFLIVLFLYLQTINTHLFQKCYPKIHFINHRKKHPSYIKGCFFSSLYLP